MTDLTENFIGIDAGTGGVRALAVTETGHVVAAADSSLRRDAVHRRDGLHEQEPAAWWEATCAALAGLTARLRSAGVSLQAARALAMDGTSGTLVCLDAGGEPLRPAMMYNDPRGSEQARFLNETAGDFCDRLGYRFASSYALAKILWVQDHEPRIFERTVHFAHQADYLVGRLTGAYGVSDYSNALKTGYDLIEERWPAWIAALPGVCERLPRVVAPGTVIGQVTSEAASLTHLPAGLPVVAGATDGTAGFLASGARRPGDYNTTLGTTLVFKGISERLCRHPQGIIYSHKLPGGRWLPGAASNTGGEWTERFFAGQDLAALDRAAAGRLPHPCFAYPLVRTGERFPFLSETAAGFFLPEPPEELDRFAAGLQGTALFERLCYEVLDDVTGSSGGEVYSTGGGSRSDVWMQCRADVTGRVLHRPAVPESAFGSAVLAGAGMFFGNLWQAVEAMVRIERNFEPNAAYRGRYDDLYQRFRAELGRRGYLSSDG